MKLFFTFIIAILGSIAIPWNAYAATVSLPSYTRVFYYVESLNARASLFAHPEDIDVLAPQTYAFDSNGQLSGGLNQNVLAFAHLKNIEVMPVVVNAQFDQASLQALLNNTSVQDAAIVELIAEAKKQGYWGWQLDLEQMDVSYRDKYSIFVEKVHRAFQENNLVLSVAVVAQVSENPNDYPNNLWTKLIGAYDYKALGANSDFVSVMSYDDPGSKDAVAPYTWMTNVLKFSLTEIPAEKISLGIPLYYWKWNTITGKLVSIGGYEGIKNTLKTQKKITQAYNTTLQAEVLKYTVSKVPYILYYENSRSMASYISLINNNGLNGFSAWAIGLESPDIYKIITR